MWDVGELDTVGLLDTLEELGMPEDLGLLLSVSVLTTVYSYVQWRKDPDGKTRSDVPFVRLGLSGREAAEEKSGAAPGRRRR